MDSTRAKAKFNLDRIRTVSIDAIRPAPENLQLYRPVHPDDPEVIELANSIQEHGLQEPIVATRDGYILSGHRRHMAARLAGLSEVPCRMTKWTHADHPERFLRLLREFNRQRVKTREELLCEEIVAATPEEAYCALREFRTRQAKRKAGQSVEITGEKRRAQISEAKRPMLTAVKRVVFELEEVWPLTVRQIHYQLLNDPPLKHASKPDSAYGNDKHSYAALVDLLTRARLSNIVPWDAIGDETRPVLTWQVYPSIQPYLRERLDNFLRTYWRDLMQSQPHHVEIVGEKGTLLGTLRPVAMKFCIPLTLGRGYCSLVPRHDMAERYWATGKDRLLVLMLSDFDPEGEDIAHSFARSMRDDFHISRIDVRKVALTAEQVAEFELPPILEAKTTSSRYSGFVEKHGTTVHELEALKPKTLQELLEKAIDSAIDRAAYNHEVLQEQADAAFLTQKRQLVLRLLRDTEANE